MSLPGLIVGSFMPDIEVPILIIFFSGILPDHYILHSFIGAITIGTLLSVFITVYFYPFFISKIFKLDEDRLNQACGLNLYLVLSCMLGNIFHILLDIPMHSFNPVLWTFIDPYQIVGFLVILFTINGDVSLGFFAANLLSSLIMLLLGAIIIIKIFMKNKNTFWERIFIGN